MDAMKRVTSVGGGKPGGLQVRFCPARPGVAPQTYGLLDASGREEQKCCRNAAACKLLSPIRRI
jgi:hypothetical protein